MKKPIFTGVCTALITPFRNGSVDLSKVDALLEHQMTEGITSVCICGTTGEASTMSDHEQWDLISHVVMRYAGKLKIIVGVGSNCTDHAVTKARMASSMGADAVLCVTPYYNKAGQNGLAEHFLRVADASAVPVILYNVPSRTGVDIPLPVYKELSKAENIIGVKDAAGNISRTAQIMAECGEDFYIWSGNDDMIVPMMALGAKGVISVLSNLCPAQALAMTCACENGHYKTAGKLQCRYLELISALFCEVNPIPIKEAMNLAGFDVGTPRLPLGTLDAENREKLIRAMENARILMK